VALAAMEITGEDWERFMIRALTFGVALVAAAAALRTVACRAIDLADRGSRRRQRSEERRRGEEAEVPAEAEAAGRRRDRHAAGRNAEHRPRRSRATRR
jgi:hypothetical protein